MFSLVEARPKHPQLKGQRCAHASHVCGPQHDPALLLDPLQFERFCMFHLEERTPPNHKSGLIFRRRMFNLHLYTGMCAHTWGKLPRIQNMEVSYNRGTPWYPQISRFKEDLPLTKHPAIGLPPCFCGQFWTDLRCHPLMLFIPRK